MPSPLQKLRYYIVSSREISLRTKFNDFFQTLLIMKILVIGITIIIITGFFATNLNSKNTAYDALKENKKVEILISFFNSFSQFG